MRITCHTLGGFLANVRGVNVFRGVVHLQKTKRAIEPPDAPVDKATSVLIGCQLSAVLDYGEDGQALVECGFECGMDRVGVAPEQIGGTEEFEKVEEELRSFCDAQELKIRPGILDI